MTTVFLFAATVLIWGTTWIAIAFQIGPVPVIISVVYRFALAGALMLLVLAVIGKLSPPPVWRFVVIQALCLFSFNFVGLYNATALIPSGLVSVVFSLASIFNAINARLLFGDAVERRVVFAGILGTCGLVLLFWHDLFLRFDTDSMRGIAWAVLGTLLFSLGSMASRKNGTRGISPVTANAWGMPIGAVVLTLVALASGYQFVPPMGGPYWIALIYLAVFGSVVGFTTYLLLVQRMGSAKAGYATVAFPVVALMISTIFEGYQWTPAAGTGVCLIVIGNIIMFARFQGRAQQKT